MWRAPRQLGSERCGPGLRGARRLAHVPQRATYLLATGFLLPAAQLRHHERAAASRCPPPPLCTGELCRTHAPLPRSYAIMNALPAMALCLYGFLRPDVWGGVCFGAGLGITLFGISYM